MNYWLDYKIISTGDGEKLEDWAGIKLLRPDPQVIWKANRDLSKENGLHARYERSSQGGGKWIKLLPHPEEWTVSWRNLTFKIKPMGFKHTGLFPEQAVNWAKMMELIENAKREISVLNLFAYTGGATLACMSKGATVTHVDASKGMVSRAAENIELSKLDRNKVRFIVDDCFKFVSREIKRGNKYDAIIMDPPSFGRGPNGEMWKMEEGIFELCMECNKILSNKPLFFLINSYTTGLQPSVLSNILNMTIGGKVEAYEVVLPTEEEGIVLPCGCSGMAVFI